MPGFAGELTDEDRRKIDEWLASKWRNRVCPICANTEWIAPGFLERQDFYNPSGFVLGGPFTVYVVVTCTACGFAHRFNGIMMGLLPPRPSEEPKVKDGGEA